MNPQETEEAIVEEIIKQFDFEKCQRVMKYLKWTWALVGIPTIEHLKETARDMMYCAIKGLKDSKCHHNEPYFCATGGFKASAFKNVYNHIIQVQLEFVLTEWDCDGDYFEPPKEDN